MKISIVGGSGALMSVLDSLPKKMESSQNTASNDVVITLVLETDSLCIQYRTRNFEFDTKVPVARIEPGTASIRILARDLLNVIGCCEPFSDVTIEFVGQLEAEKLVIYSTDGDSEFTGEIRGIYDVNFLSNNTDPTQRQEGCELIRLVIDSEVLGTAISQCIGAVLLMTIIESSTSMIEMRCCAGSIDTFVCVPCEKIFEGGRPSSVLEGRISAVDVEAMHAFLIGFGGAKTELSISSNGWMNIRRKLITNNDGELNILLGG
jgi:hypothetical protein